MHVALASIFIYHCEVLALNYVAVDPVGIIYTYNCFGPLTGNFEVNKCSSCNLFSFLKIPNKILFSDEFYEMVNSVKIHCNLFEEIFSFSPSNLLHLTKWKFTKKVFVLV